MAPKWLMKGGIWATDAAGKRIIVPDGSECPECCGEPGNPCPLCSATVTPKSWVVTFSGVSMCESSIATAVNLDTPGNGTYVYTPPPISLNGTYTLTQDSSPFRPCSWFIKFPAPNFTFVYGGTEYTVTDGVEVEIRLTRATTAPLGSENGWYLSASMGGLYLVKDGWFTFGSLHGLILFGRYEVGIEETGWDAAYTAYSGGRCCDPVNFTSLLDTCNVTRPSSGDNDEATFAFGATGGTAVATPNC